jgi:signal transduction histidine kinase
LTGSARSGLDSPLFEESVEELYERAPCGYLSTLPDGTIARVNHTFLAWTGAAREEVIGKRLHDLLTVPGRIYLETHLGPLLTMQGFVNEIALEVLCRDRPPLPVLLSAVQKRDGAGEPVLNRVMVFNAVERRKYEHELLLARRRAERADKAKADLLAMIGHDMRTPLGAIRGAVYLLERQSPSPAQAKYLRMLQSSTAALLGLADQILEFSRLEAGQALIANERFDPRAVVRDTLDAVSRRADEKGIALVQEVEPEVPASLSGDPLKIQQILTNLAGNAVKFTERGAVTIAVRLLHRGADAAMIGFTVSDTGIGIPKDRLGAIFEEFTQADAEIGRKYGGTGLGLTICRRLAELLGGELAVESELGKGSTFRLKLQLAVA